MQHGAKVKRDMLSLKNKANGLANYGIQTTIQCEPLTPYKALTDIVVTVIIMYMECFW